jgi:hypothetical protein
MSYLDTTRLHFSGRFLANPSTVNNHPAHYDNDTFNRTVHWQPGQGSSAAHGWWNPEGPNLFRFEDVTITAAYYEDGEAAAAGADGIFDFHLESRGINPAKIADLDPDQQLVSMIYGLDVALVDSVGRIALEGAFEPAPFTDIWRKGPPPGGDAAASVAYQSVLIVRSWGDLATSKFLQQLKQAATDGILSIKFNLDGYSMNRTAPDFTTGRIAGTLGPGRAQDPKHWTKGRHFGNEVHPIGSAFPGFVTGTGVNYFVAALDPARKKVRLDLGNGLPVNPAGKDMQDIGKLFLGFRKSDGSTSEIAEINYLQGGWYARTAGIAEVPADRELTDNEMQQIASAPLRLVAHDAGGQKVVSEETGAHIRADLFVARLNPGDTAVFHFHASRLGRPLPETRINLTLFIPDHLTGADFPVTGLDFPDFVDTDSEGNAAVTLTASDPGNPRFFLTWGSAPRTSVDGQVYWVAYQIDGEPQPNPSNFLSILVWNTFVPDEPPTWHGSMRAVFEQFGNLYPWMSKFGPQIDLANYDEVADAREDVRRVISLAETDRHHMPVTRDLSRSRRDAMLRWLTNLDVDGRPRLGVAPEVPIAGIAPEPEMPAAAMVAAADRGELAAERGSKTAAGERVMRTIYRTGQV